MGKKKSKFNKILEDDDTCDSLDENDLAEEQENAIQEACDTICDYLKRKNRENEGAVFKTLHYKGHYYDAEDALSFKAVDAMSRLLKEDADFDDNAELDLITSLLLKQAIKVINNEEILNE